MSEIGLPAYPSMHTASDFQLSMVSLSQFIDNKENDGEFYPPLCSPGVDDWFTFIHKHFQVYICQPGREDECDEDFYCWSMTTPYHAMGSNFPIFATGELVWLDPEDCDGDEMIGLVKVREGSPRDKEPINRMHVFIDTSMEHPAFGTNMKFQSKGFLPNQHEEAVNKCSPRFEFQTSPTVCVGLCTFEPGGECGTIAHELKIIDVHGQRPPTKCVPQPTSYCMTPLGTLTTKGGGRKDVQRAGGGVASTDIPSGMTIVPPLPEAVVPLPPRRASLGVPAPTYAAEFGGKPGEAVTKKKKKDLSSEVVGAGTESPKKERKSRSRKAKVRESILFDIYPCLK